MISNYQQFNDDTLSACMSVVCHSLDGHNVLRYMIYELPSYGLIHSLHCYYTLLMHGNPSVSMFPTMQSMCNGWMLNGEDRQVLTRSAVISIIKSTDASTRINWPVRFRLNVCRTGTMCSVLAETLCKLPDSQLAHRFITFFLQPEWMYSCKDLFIFLSRILSRHRYVSIFIHLAVPDDLSSSATTLDLATKWLDSNYSVEKILELEALCMYKLWLRFPTPLHRSLLDRASDILYASAEKVLQISHVASIEMCENIAAAVTTLEICASRNHAPSKAALGTILFFGLEPGFDGKDSSVEYLTGENKTGENKIRGEQLWNECIPDLQADCLSAEPSTYALFWLGCLTYHGGSGQLQINREESMRLLGQAIEKGHRLARDFVHKEYNFASSSESDLTDSSRGSYSD